MMNSYENVNGLGSNEVVCITVVKLCRYEIAYVNCYLSSLLSNIIRAITCRHCLQN